MTTLKEFLSNKLNKKELSLVPTSFDIVGDIAIFNKFPKELNNKEKLIGNTLVRLNKNIKIVAVKSKAYSGKLRLPKLKIIAGENRKETIHKENGVRLKLNVEKCYFSSRLGTERLRIAQLIKNKEKVLVLFSGVAPYPCVIAKNSKAKEIYGIELNRIAHKYALENLKLNKINNIKLFLGDVKKILPKINEKFDRTIVPLPKDSSAYLTQTLKKLKPQGTIHLYLFSQEKDFKKLINKYKKKFKLVKLTKCGAYSPRVYRVCLDLKN